MLQFIRDRATGWLAWAIVILIAIPFALWGIHQYMTPTSSVAVASVNGSELGLRDFQRAYQRQIEQFRALLGASIDELPEERLREQTLNMLVEDEVVIQTALSQGLRIGDSQLAVAIQSQSLFRDENSFSSERYELWLRNQGYSAQGFELDLRRSMLSEQMANGIAASAFVTETDLAAVARLERQVRSFSMLTLPAARFADEPVSEEAVEEYYRANMADFVTPEQVKVSYLEVSRDEIAQDIRVSEDELRSLYEQRKDNYRTAETREASHILVRLGLDAPEEEVAAARAKIEELRRRIEEGESFEDLAREHSEDPGSAKQGGSLGSFGRGVMDPAFEDAAFSLEVGEVSEPVRSSFGLHLIKVTGVQPAEVRGFDEVREALSEQYRREEAEQIFFEQVEQLANLTFEHPASLEVAAEVLGLPIQESAWISPRAETNTGIGTSPEVIEAAFDPEVIEAGNNSEPIELETTRVVVLRVKEHRPATQQALEEVREEIRERLAREAARARATTEGEKALARLRGGEDPLAVAGDLELEWSAGRELRRDSQEVGAAVREAVFRIPRPAAGEVAYDGVVTDAGDFAVIALADVADGELEQLAETERDTARRSLEAQLGRAGYDAVVRALRDDADVTIHRENL